MSSRLVLHMDGVALMVPVSDLNQSLSRIKAQLPVYGPLGSVWMISRNPFEATVTVKVVSPPRPRLELTVAAQDFRFQVR